MGEEPRKPDIRAECHEILCHFVINEKRLIFIHRVYFNEKFSKLPKYI